LPNNLKSKTSIFFKIQGTSLTGFLEAFHSSLAQSTNELSMVESVGENIYAKILAGSGVKGLTPLLPGF